jgi:hypothetical protein
MSSTVENRLSLEYSPARGLAARTREQPEFRNHHISNAGTCGENLGVNAAMVVAGVHWVLR